MSIRAHAEKAHLETADDGAELLLKVSGRLDAASIAGVWPKARSAVRKSSHDRVIVDAAGVEYCDGSGAALFVDLVRQGSAAGKRVEVRHLADEFAALLKLYEPEKISDAALSPSDPPSPGFFHDVGRAVVSISQDIREQIEFVGHLVSAMAGSLLRPRSIRWEDLWRAIELAVINALPIVALISFLIGLIMAFEAAIPMRQFGAEIYAANLVALSMLRELGPLMTAIILAGRTGASFAAEIGTMKVNEEVDALVTMGLEPMRFLVIPRVIAVVIMTPLLTLFSNLLGLAGGALVIMSLGFPLVTYWNQVQQATDAGDLIVGLVKAAVFGTLIAAIGCLRGLQTERNASAVGLSTTRAVVSGIVWIILADGVFSVILFYLDK